jgi:hypothetical protein
VVVVASQHFVVVSQHFVVVSQHFVVVSLDENTLSKFGRDFTLWHATQPSNRVLTSSKNKLVCALFQHTVSSLRLGLNKDMNWEVGSTGHKWRRIIRDCHSTVDSLLEYSVQWWAKNQYECSRTSRIRSFPNAISSFVDCGNEFATAPNTQVLERHTSSSYIV